MGGGVLGLLPQIASPAYSAETGASLRSKYLRDQCVFSNGTTLTFGAKAFGSAQDTQNGWRTGEYVATPLRVNGHVIIQSLGHRIDIPAGSYTLFWTDHGNPPTLIISRENGRWGMPYPGEQYDLGRMQSGFDVRPAMKGFAVGCTQNGDAPIFFWMQSGTSVAYNKVLAERFVDGRSEYVVH